MHPCMSSLISPSLKHLWYCFCEYCVWVTL